MAYALVGSRGAVVTNGAPAFGQATTAGNLLIAWVVDRGGCPSAPATGTGWTLAEGGSTHQLAIFYKQNCGAGETAPTFAVAVDQAAALAEFSGGATASPLDQIGSDFGGAASPQTTTAGAVDAALGELVIGIGYHALSKAGTTTTTVTYNNGATDNSQNNDGTSAQLHYRFSYGITTGNASADSYTNTDTSMNLSNLRVALVSFKLASTARVPRSPGVDSGNAHL